MTAECRGVVATCSSARPNVGQHSRGDCCDRRTARHCVFSFILYVPRSLLICFRCTHVLLCAMSGRAWVRIPTHARLYSVAALCARPVSTYRRICHHRTLRACILVSPSTRSSVRAYRSSNCVPLAPQLPPLISNAKNHVCVKPNLE